MVLAAFCNGNVIWKMDEIRVLMMEFAMWTTSHNVFYKIIFASVQYIILVNAVKLSQPL